MRLLGKLKLSHKIFAILLVIPSLTILSLLYYSALQHVDIRNKPLEQMALSSSASVADKIKRNMKERHSDAQAFAYNKVAVEALEKDKKDSSIQNYMNTMVSYSALYDLTMLCDITGKVIAVNTKDANKKDINSDFLIGKDMNMEEWFRSSIVVGGPKGGTYYSDFYEDETIGQIYNNKGYGINFSAPVRDEEGNIIGVWRNHGNWQGIAQEIRKEAETNLQKEINGAIILLMDKQGYIIDADKKENILKITIGKNNLFKNFDFNYSSININDKDYIYGWSKPENDYTAIGHKWNYLTLIPRVKLTDSSIYLHSDWTTLMIFSVSLLLIGIIISLIFVRSFSKRMNTIKKSILNLSKGKTEIIENIKYRDEIGEMSMALNTLTTNFSNIANFSNEIGMGNLSASYNILGEEDSLGISLLQMKNNLKTIEIENQKQKWSSEKLTVLGEILRQLESAEVKFNKAISLISKSTGAFQGALFVINEMYNPPIIELKAGFALTSNRLKMPPLIWGETAVGQCIKDRELIRINNLPEDYVNIINSGLGSSVPSEIIILPLLFNNKVEGAIELSGFKPFETHMILFLEKASEYLGSFIFQNRINEQQEQVCDINASDLD